MSKILLMANKAVGSKVARHLIEQGHSIVALFLTEDNNSENADLIKITQLPENLIFRNKRAHNIESVVSSIPEFDYLITVYWPYIIKGALIDRIGTNSINFHPAMLPQNRGWYPHVFNILNGRKAGVTLHVINNGADTGPIWAQREIKVLDEDTSDTLYYRLQDEIYQLFVETWPKILNKEIEPKEQDETNASYNSINEVEKFNEIKLDKNYSGKELINILRARTFGDFGYAYFINNENKRVKIRIKLN